MVGMSGVVMANPIRMVDETSAQQIPGTTHMLLFQASSMSSLSTMVVTRDGDPVAVVGITATTRSEDLGSGMASVWQVTACDCNVPMGQHSYGVGAKTLDVEVVDPADADDGSGGGHSDFCDAPCASQIPVQPEGGAGGEGGAAAGAAGRADSAGGAGGGAAGEADGGNGEVGGAGSGGRSSNASGAGGVAEATGGTTPTGGTQPVPTGGTAPATGGTATGGTAPATGGTQSVTEPAETGGESSAGATVTAGAAPSASPAKKHTDSSGCAISRARGRLLPFGILAAVGLLFWRRKK